MKLIPQDDPFFSEDAKKSRRKYNTDERLRWETRDPVANKISPTARQHSKRFWDNLREQRDTQPVLTRCAFCTKTHSGTLAEGRAWHTKHRKTHPQAKAKTRRKVHGQTMVAGADLETNIANARAQGGHRFKDTK